MDKITTKQIRNVCLLGHSGSGKTSVAEAMLYLTKASDRLGKVTDGNTVCDYDPEEIKRGFTLSASIAPIMWKEAKINIIDAPGYLDFSGEVLQAVRVADSAMIVVDGKAGVEVGTELAWDYATDAKLPKAFFINKCDENEADFDRVFDELHSNFGTAVCPVFVPVKSGNEVTMVDLIEMKSFKYDAQGKRSEVPMSDEFKAIADKYKDTLNEAIAGTSDDLMMKYFDGEEITKDEAIEALHNGIIEGTIVPVYCGSAVNMWGIIAVLDAIEGSFPRPTAKGCEKDVDGNDVAIEKEGGNPAIFVFKTIADPFVGKMSFFKVMNGELTRDTTLKNITSGSSEKLAHIYTIRGKKQTEVDYLCCGDIGMTAKLANTNTNDTLSVAEIKEYRKIVYPEAFLTMAVMPKAKGDEDKISSGINRLIEEDRTLKFENNAELKQLLVSGFGDIHLDVMCAKLKNRYSTSVELTAPKIAYRETIKKSVQQEGKHKKQSGGSGQYGHVKITFSPGEADGLTFTESVVGGSVPKGYYPAVEKGLLEAMQKGVLAGFPVVNLAADLFDGSYHPVDSNEISFKLAAKIAYKEGLPKANPVILEPVGELKVYVPDALVGDVIGDLNKRRGRVLGMSAHETKKGYQVVEAEVPKSEMQDYTISLRALSQGKGSFTFYFVRYEEVPAMIAQKVIEEAKKNAEEDK